MPREYQFWFGLPSERVLQGQGSGFAISADGYIITNHHVIENADEIIVRMTSFFAARQRAAAPF